MRKARAQALTELTLIGVAALAAWLGPAELRAWPPILVEPVNPSPPPALPFPEALEHKIRFWQSIYVEHPSHRVVIHDRDDPSIIWRVVELPRLDDGRVDESSAAKLVKEEMQDVSERLRHLENGNPPQDEADRALLAAVEGNTARLDGASLRLRSQRGVADKFAAALERAARWSAGIQQILVEEGVPAELAALPFIESMFNPHARSAAGAAGLWQLMPSTARWLGLEVSKRLDERLDVLKSTRAAARLLRKNYEMLGSWPLAITAYNHGHNGLRRAIEEVGSTDLVYLIQNYEKPTWGFSSKNFYAGFLAALRTYTAARASDGSPAVAGSEAPEDAEAVVH